MYEIVQATYIDGYRIELIFENGKRGIIDFTEYLNLGGFFISFRILIISALFPSIVNSEL